MAEITTKELSFLEDQLEHEQVLVKKYRAYAEAAGDSAVKNRCESIAAKHQEHFDRLMTYLG